MKGHVRKFVGLAILFVAITSTAQVGLKANVTVPFAFNAAGHQCPAGEYQVAINKSNDVITLTRMGYTQAVVLGKGAGSSTDGGSFLRFQQVGEEMFLQDAAISRESENIQLPKAATSNREVAQSKADSGAGAR